MVAAQQPLAAVDGEPCITVATLGQPTAVVAEQGGRIASAIQEKQSLFSLAQGFTYGFQQWLGKSGFQHLFAKVQRCQSCSLAASN